VNPVILSFQNVSKMFHVYQSQRTLFRIASSVIQGKRLARSLWALRDVTFEIRKGDKIAVIGRNGAGKTTLFRVAAGIYKPTSGRIQQKENVKSLFRYGLGLNAQLSVLDNIYLMGAYYGMLVAEVRKKLDEILDFSELEEFLYAPVKHLSSGQVQRLCFSVFIQSRESFMAFDESTSMADLRFQKKVGMFFDDLFRSDQTLLLASHNLSDLAARCRHAIWLEKGGLQAYGPTAEVIKGYQDFCDQYEAESTEQVRDEAGQQKLER